MGEDMTICLYVFNSLAVIERRTHGEWMGKGVSWLISI